MWFGVGGLAALALLFLAVVMLSNIGLRGARLDLTQNRLYTLSKGTQQVLDELKEPVNLYFYFSRESAAKQAPLIMPYATRVREFLSVGARPFYAFTIGVVVNVLLGFILSTQVFNDFWTRLGQ